MASGAFVTGWFMRYSTEDTLFVNNLHFRDNNFDLIRLLAAMQVMFLHGWGHLDITGTENFQWLLQILEIFPGVPIFFVISGFLISASFEKSPRIFSYAKNRFLRIYPGLWVCFFVSLITVVLFFAPDISVRTFSPWVLAQLSIGQFYNPEFLRGYGVGVLNGSLWTIPVELQFYLLLPVIYCIFRQVHWNRLFIVIFIVALICVNQYYSGLDSGDERILVKLFGVTVFPYLYIFFIGVLLQRNKEFVARFLKGKVFLWLVIYVASSLILGMMPGVRVGGNLLNPLSATILAFFAISFAYSYADRLAHILRGNDISYGVYIYHMVVFNAFIHFGIVHHAWTLILGMAIVIMAAFLSWKYVEKPALKLKNYSVNRMA